MTACSMLLLMSIKIHFFYFVVKGTFINKIISLCLITFALFVYVFSFAIFGFLYSRLSLFSAFSIFVSRYFRISLFSDFAIFGFRYFIFRYFRSESFTTTKIVWWWYQRKNFRCSIQTKTQTQTHQQEYYHKNLKDLKGEQSSTSTRKEKKTPNAATRLFSMIHNQNMIIAHISMWFTCTRTHQRHLSYFFKLNLISFILYLWQKKWMNFFFLNTNSCHNDLDVIIIIIIIIQSQQILLRLGYNLAWN